MNEKSLEQVLGDFAYNLSYEDLSSHVIETAQISVADGIACAIAGKPLPSSKIALDLWDEIKQEGRSTAWINGEKTDLESAAWINCLHMHSILHDDMQASTVGHMGSLIIPTSLATAEQEDRAGKNLLTAIVAAYEVAGRIGVNSGQAIVDRGFRGSPVFGPFAAAVAAGKLWGLTGDQLRHAIALAGNFSCGLLEAPNKGSMEWRFQNGTSLRNGIFAARLARKGLEAAPSVLEGECGFFAAFGGAELRTEILDSREEIIGTLGEEYEMSKNLFKPFATCGYNQIGVETALALVSENRISPEDIDRITIYVPPENKAYPGGEFHGPFNTIDQALLSKPFSIASAVNYGNLTVDTYLYRLNDPELLNIAKKVSVESVEEMGFLDTKIEIQTKDGNKVAGDQSLVDMKNYLLTKDYTIEKFHRMTRDALGDESAKEVVRAAFDLPEMARVSEFTAVLTSALGH